MSKAKEKHLSNLKKDRIHKFVLDAISKFRQEDFLDPIFKKKFYSYETIPIGYGEKTDPPIALAKMIKYLSPKKGFRILEIGTGSGYSTAILSSMVKEVVTIEYQEELAILANERLERLKIDNVRVFSGEGINLDKDIGVFDAIIIFAACNQRPLPLIEHLKKGGLLVFPMGPIHEQQIAILKNERSEKYKGIYKTTFHDHCSFTPLMGMYVM